MLGLALCAALALAPSERARAAERTDGAPFGRIETRSADGTIESRCVATRVAERWLLTAAHCLPATPAPPERLTLRCPSRERPVRLHATRVVAHPTHDAALLALVAAPDCLGPPLPIARKIGSDARFVGRRLDAASDLFPLPELGRDAHVLLLDDALACLGRGDSGHPVLAFGGDGDSGSGGDATLVAMLVGGTPTCPSLQSALRLDRLAAWVASVAALPSSVPPGPTAHDAHEGHDAHDAHGSRESPDTRDGFRSREPLAPGERRRARGSADADAPSGCTADGCPSIELAAASYCSLDPEQLPAAGAFATKARLELAGGRHVADARGRTTAPALVLHTPRGTTPLRALAAATVTARAAPDADDPSAARLALAARYASADGDELELVLIADRTGAPGVAHGLGGAHDAEAFLAAGRQLLLRARSPTALFPGTGRVAIAFAPCALPARADERFAFALADGTRVTFTVRAASGAHALGFYVGRVLEARVETALGVRRVDEESDLAFVGGSRQLAELALPTLAVRTPPGPAGCGYLFDASLWDTRAARDGYVARRLGCDGAAVERAPLRSARYPERYVLP